MCSAAVSVAQTTGDIAGTVTEASGVALPGVTVEAASAEPQGTRSVADRDGRYRSRPFLPGSTGSRRHFAGSPRQKRSATVSLDATATVDMTLQLAAHEEVAVSG